MSDYVKRLAGPFTGEGDTTFTFGFFTYSDDEIYVGTAMSNDEVTTILSLGVDYTVTLNDDQNAVPGGTVTLLTEGGLKAGEVLVIGSSMPYVKEIDLTNFSRFPPSQIDTEFNRLVIMIQQIVEETGRTLKVPATSSETPEDMIERLLAAQQTAQVSADEAKASAKEAKDACDEILGEQSTVIADIEAKGEEVKADVEAEGYAQADRLAGITDETLVGYGVGGRQETWALTEDVAADTEITLPNSMTYVVGRNHLRISWNGMVLYPTQNFEEVGTEDMASTKFKTLFAMKTGDVLNAWTVPLGRGDMGNVEQEVAQLTNSVAELSRKAAFHNVGEQTK